MEYKSLEIKVGITVFIAFLILVVGLMWFQGFKLAHARYQIYATFPMVGGVAPGDKVNVNGVERGSVERVTLREHDVLLTMEIDRRAQIPEDSRIVLQAVGIMGGRIVTILLGTSEKMLPPGAQMKGAYEPGVTEALAFLGNIMDELTVLTKDMRKLAETLTRGDKLGRIVDNLEKSTATLNTMLAHDTGALATGVQAFNRSAQTVDRILARNQGSIDTMITSFSAAGKDLPGLVRRMRAVTDSLAVITGRLQSGDNTLGGLMRDRALLDRLEKTVKDLDALVSDVKANPKKYLKVEIF